jgi:hypothetical protein
MLKIQSSLRVEGSGPEIGAGFLEYRQHVVKWEI